MIVTGAILMGTGENWMRREYALSIGIVLLMLGIYKSSRAWNRTKTGDTTENDA
jgi:hypothetical protein